MLFSHQSPYSKWPSQHSPVRVALKAWGCFKGKGLQHKADRLPRAAIWDGRWNVARPAKALPTTFPGLNRCLMSGVGGGGG